MESRERVALALAHQEPDRVPIDYWATPEVTARLLRRLGLSSQEELLRHFEVDFRYIDGPRYIGPAPAAGADGSVEDHWGVPRVRVQVGSGDTAAAYWEVARFPLQGARSVEEVRGYPKWPSPDWFDYGVVREQVAAARQTGKVAVFMGDRLNRCAQLKPAMYLRGVEQILIDLALNPEIAAAIFQRIAAFYQEYTRRTLEAAAAPSAYVVPPSGGVRSSAFRRSSLLDAGGQEKGTPEGSIHTPPEGGTTCSSPAECGIDILMMGDDFGTQTGPFVSPAMWRRFLRPGFQAFIGVAKRFGCKVAHHSCGSIQPLIPDLIECGLDILNPLQPDVADMDPRQIKRRFGGRLAFHGAISIQRTLPFGTPEDVRREVRDRSDTLAPGGGYIFCTAHNIQGDTPLENIEALFEAYRTEGRY